MHNWQLTTFIGLVEVYIGEHFEVGFNHGICPDCLIGIYSEPSDTL